MSPSGLTVVHEGTTELLVPTNFNPKGPGRRSRDVFYNKQMEFGRDISVMVGRAVFREGQKILDGLAASGARGLRLANECGVKADFILNDKDLAAAVLMKQNADQNSLGHVRIECRDLRSLLADERFDYIDIDPFGTPVDFIDPAVQSCNNNGIIAITATDTAPLYGVYPKTCLRRYGALSQRSPFAHETGLRILAGKVIRQAAEHDRAALPIFCYHADHYFRCYLRVRNGAARADGLIRKLGYAHFDSRSLDRQVVEDRLDEKDAGPIWTGAIFSTDLLKAMKASGDLGTANRCDKYLRTWAEEAASPALYYSIDELARKTKISPPKLADFVESLVEKGAMASRTHFDPKGFKTDMSLRDLLNVYRRTSRQA